jgi:hypothetical protein
MIRFFMLGALDNSFSRICAPKMAASSKLIA